MGIERLLALIDAPAERTQLDVYVVNQGEEAARFAFRVSEALRDLGFGVLQHCGGGSFKTQMRKADASGATVAVIVGDEEAGAGEATIKMLREDRPQFKVPLDGLAEALSDLLFASQEDDE
jgi:histidyl-tRNA synthetase